MVIAERALLDRLTEYCRSRLPFEACGVLLGTSANDGGGIGVSSFLPMRNAAPDRLRAFAFAPEEWIRVVMGDMPVIGIFHSHPQTLPSPSAADLALPWAFPTYWIVSFKDPAAPEIRAHRIENRSAREQSLHATVSA